MEEIRPRLTIGDVFCYALAYLFWVVTAALGMVTVLLVRNALNFVWPLMGWSRWVLRPVDRFGLVFLGLVWLVYVIFVEQYYRQAITEARERRRRQRVRPDAAPESMPKNVFTRLFRRLNLDILVRRFVPTVVVPLVVLSISQLIQEIVQWAVTR